MIETKTCKVCGATGERGGFHGYTCSPCYRQVKAKRYAEFVYRQNAISLRCQVQLKAALEEQLHVERMVQKVGGNLKTLRHAIRKRTGSQRSRSSSI